MPAKKKQRAMSAEHKKALAAGRAEGIAVRRYLETLEANAPKRGRRRTPESIAKRLAAIDDALSGVDPFKRLQLIQEHADLQGELAAMETSNDLSELEEAFVAAAQGYSERKGIAYGTWRKVGVPAEVLKRVGISRGA